MMNTTCEPSPKPKLIPSSLEELELMVRKAVGSIGAQPEHERAAVYSRVSNIDQRSHSYSMEFQPDRSEEYAHSKGWQIVGLYADPDRTGRNSRRSDLQRMIRDIESGKISVVVIHRLDRLYRNLESLLSFLRFIKAHRVRLVSVTEQIDTDSWWGRLVFYVLGALAEMYVWQTSDRVREIKAELSRKGHHNGTIPIGYCNGLCSTCEDLNGPGYCPLAGKTDRSESQRGRIPLPHPVDQHMVLLVHTLYSQGMSFHDIANYLNTHRFRLPDGQEFQFRTKGVGNKRPGRPFNRDSVREIIGNPFYIGMVVRRPNLPLDMDDDRAPGSNEYRSASGDIARKKIKKYPDGMTQRSIVEMHKGRHQGIVPISLWQANQQERKNRSSVPHPNGKPLHEYLLTGVAYCWECHTWDGRQASLRGITGNGYQYYRCATMQGEYKIRHKPHPQIFTAALTSLQMDAVEQENRQSLISRHRSTFQKKAVEEQVSQLIDQLVIPVDWYDLILAYYLNDKGMSEFELEGYNLRQELTRQRELFKRGHITQAEYEQAYLFIDRQLQRLKPSSQAEAKGIIPLLGDFSNLWQQLTLTERRAILQAMFAGLYFDSGSQLCKVSANCPFDRLLGLTMPEPGIQIELKVHG